MSLEKKAHSIIKIAKIVGILVCVFISINLALTIWVFRRDLVKSELYAIIAALVPMCLLILALYLEIRKNKNKRKVWLLIFLLFLIGAFSSLIIVGFDLDLVIEQLDDFRFVVFIVFYMVSGIFCLLIYSTIKTWKKPARNSKKTTVFAVIALIFLVGNVVFLGIGNQYLITGNIQNGIGYTEGPWATFHAGTNDSITISWLTNEKNSSTIYYGTDINNLSLTYYNPEKVHLHNAILENLLPNTTYYYQIPEDFITPHSSDEFKFKMGSDDLTSFRFAVFGDKQPTSEHLMISNQFVTDGIIAGDYDFAVQVGDLASTGSQMEDWHLTLNSLSQLGATTPLQMVIGNHDWSGIVGAANWKELFNYPFESGPGANYYSFDYGNAHFVMIDNFEIFYRMSEAQLQWIEEDILDAKDRGQKWIFAFFHSSLFTTATSGFYPELKMQLLPIFDKGGVDAAFFGHDHHYEHWNYTYGENNLVFSEDHDWEHNSVQYFCTGGGGANLEVDYGVLDRSPSIHELTWYNRETNLYEARYYEKNSWNSEKYVENPSFEIDYTQYHEDGIHDGKYYYHAPLIESYANFTSEFGLMYGEQSFHFMDISIEGDTCIIKAVYPNGQILMGPEGTMPQEIILTK